MPTFARYCKTSQADRRSKSSNDRLARRRIAEGARENPARDENPYDRRARKPGRQKVVGRPKVGAGRENVVDDTDRFWRRRGKCFVDLIERLQSLQRYSFSRCGLM